MPLQHTLGHQACPACAKTRREIMLLGYGIPRDTPFDEASDLWIESLTFNGASKRHRYLGPRTLNDYRLWISALKRFFGGMPLQEIHIGNVVEYQQLRASGQLAAPARKGKAVHPEVGPNRINQELALLVRIMKRAECWSSELDLLYRPLDHEESNIPQALTPAQQQFFLDVASSRLEWQVVYWYFLLGLHTTLSNYEMRGLQLGDVNLYGRYLMVRAAHAKRPGRIRTIPLTDDAMWAAERLLERAHGLGAIEPQHYLFPYRDRVTHEYKPGQPMTYWGVRKDWEEVRAAAGVPWFGPHDLRHTAITRLAEAGTPIPVIMSLAGHLSQRMMEHYTHISEASKLSALTAAHASHPRPPRPDHRATVTFRLRPKALV